MEKRIRETEDLVKRLSIWESRVPEGRWEAAREILILMKGISYCELQGWTVEIQKAKKDYLGELILENITTNYKVIVI